MTTKEKCIRFFALGVVCLNIDYASTMRSGRGSSTHQGRLRSISVSHLDGTVNEYELNERGQLITKMPRNKKRPDHSTPRANRVDVLHFPNDPQPHQPVSQEETGDAMELPYQEEFYFDFDEQFDF